MKPRIQQFQRIHQIDLIPLSFYTSISYQVCARRGVHSSSTKHASATAPQPAILSAPQSPAAQSYVAGKQPLRGSQAPLSVLPTSYILRTYLITRLSSSPTLLNLTFRLLDRILESNSPLFSTDRNPLLRWLLKKTFYAQFCAGENGAEVQRTAARVKDVGFSGVILEYALEVLKEGHEKARPNSSKTLAEIETWRKGMMETVAMAQEGDFVGLKYAHILISFETQ